MSDGALGYEERLYREIGRRIREARKQCNVSQEELGKQVKLKRTSVTNIEKGRQRFLVHKLYEIAEALKVQPEAFFPKPADLVAPTERMLERVDSSARPFTESIFKKAKVSE